MTDDNITWVWPTPVNTPVIIRRPAKASLSWGRARNLIDELIEGLGALGLSDPSGAAALNERARELRTNARRVSPDTFTVNDLVASAAKGDVAADDVVAAVGERMAGVDPDRKAAAAREALNDAAHTAYREALRAVQGFGEEAWLALLQPIAEKATPSKRGPGDERTFNACHNVAATLRTIGALEVVEDASPAMYRIARPEVIHAWRCEHPQAWLAVWERWVSRDRKGEYVVCRVKRGPRPAWRQLASPELAQAGMGLHSAREVADNLRRLAALEKEQRGDAYHGAPDPPRPTARFV